MNTLTREAFNRARDFIKTQARLLDRALFEHRFEDAPAKRVAAALSRYQNADGGFGHALEPDVRTPHSSALATGIGLTLLKELGFSPAHPMAAQAVVYLHDTFLEDEMPQVWRVIPPEANDAPHAPWWHDEVKEGKSTLAQTFDNFLIIPRAQIVGLLHHYAALVPTDWLDAVTEATVASIATLGAEAFGGGGDTLRYALDLAETAALPASYRDRLRPRLRAVADQIVCRDPAAWSGYCPTPLKIAPTPDCIVADVLDEALATHLDHVIAHQTEAGSWEPTWTWGDAYPDAWAEAKREWRGHLTLETLTSLHAFGRLKSAL
jgi:hypothetical protein